jgi:uncharacterized membrane protein
VIGNLLFLLSDGLDSWADDNLEPSKVRMMVQMNTKGNIASGAVEDTAVAFLEENLPEGYTYMVAGVAQVEIAITDLIVGAQTSSILISIIIVFLILSCVFQVSHRWLGGDSSLERLHHDQLWAHGSFPASTWICPPPWWPPSPSG